MFVNNPFFQTLHERPESATPEQDVIFDRLTPSEEGAAAKNGQDVLSVYRSQPIAAGVSRQRLEFREIARVRTESSLGFGHSYFQDSKTLLLDSPQVDYFYRLQFNRLNFGQIQNGELSFRELHSYLEYLERPKQQGADRAGSEQFQLLEFQRELFQLFETDFPNSPLVHSWKKTKKNDFELDLLANESFKDSSLSVDNQELARLFVHRKKKLKLTADKIESFREKIGDLMEAVKRGYQISNYLYMHPLSE